MKYYGYQRLPQNSIKNKKHKLNTLYNTLGIKILNRWGFGRTLCLFYLPPSWNFILLSNTAYHYRIYFYSSTYFFKFFVPQEITLIKYSPLTHTLSFFYLSMNNFFKHFFFYFKKLFYSFSVFFFKKIKFKGKGYYIFKNKRNTVTFRFGYSHRIYLYFFGNFVKFLSKTSIFIFGINYNEIVNYGHRLIQTRPYNLFTGKGVRFTRQIIYKKIGKVGSYR